jgi:hypothetical protein
MAFDKIVIGQAVSAAKEGIKLERALDVLKEKAIEIVSNQIDNQVPTPLPFSTKDILLGGSLPNISTPDVSPADLLSPDLLSQVSAIPDNVKTQTREVLTTVEDTLNTIIDQKNTIQEALSTITGPINTLEGLTSTINDIVSIVDGTITGLKAIPLPLAAPPGIGVPANVVIGFSDLLSDAKIYLDTLKGPLSVVPPTIEQINGILSTALEKISSFDPIFDKSTSIITFIKVLLDVGPGATQQDIDRIALDTTANIRKSLTTPVVSLIDEDLDPNSNVPINYRGYILTTEYDSSNTFSFPRRRIKASLATNPNNFILGPYSYSSSTQVLIDEIKFRIDQILSNS